MWKKTNKQNNNNNNNNNKNSEIPDFLRSVNIHNAITSFMEKGINFIFSKSIANKFDL